MRNNTKELELRDLGRSLEEVLVVPGAGGDRVRGELAGDEKGI